MPNMKHCRFANTRGDVDECLQALLEGEEIRVEETGHCKGMFKAILEYCRDSGMIDAYDMAPLVRYLDSLNK